jgi:RNA polymerase sigma-70 factor, ECF subfamily
MKADMKNDQELMLEYCQGKQEALEELFSRYKKKIFNYCLRFLRNQADAEDVAGEVFLTLSVKKDSYQPQYKFSTWFYAVARNACIDRWRKRKRFVFMWFKKEKGGYDLWDIPDKRIGPAEASGRHETEHYVKKAISRLPLFQREVVILREYQLLSYAEIAGVLGVSEEKVKVSLFRARQRLKQYLLPILSEIGNV